MKRKFQWILFILSLFVFIFLRLHSISKSHSPIDLQRYKPSVSQANVTLKNHPWIELQPLVKNADLEIERDLNAVANFCKQIKNFSEEEATFFLIKTLLDLQRQIPFQFPEELYNLLCIPEPLEQGSYPYDIYQRLYLCENELGFPFYMDVRVFNLATASADHVIAWHLQTLDGEMEILQSSDSRSTFLLRGNRSSNRFESHGFAQILGKRRLFLDFVKVKDQLFVCYAEASERTFQKIEPLLRKLANSSLAF